ncbi:MAG: hypothetical protein H8D75_02640 [Rhodospirillaceae bacterium]|nr:hypothetical protein [Rhodospirillaceae bacterium]
MQIAFDDMKSPVAFRGCDEMAPAIGSILQGWSFHKARAADHPSPAITISRTPSGYARESEWLSEPVVYPNIINAACDFLVDAFKCYVANNPSLLCLHTAAVDFGDGLYLFPSTYNAGKSTLCVHLASLGMKVYADDVLYLNGDSRGMAPGVLPRLRLPLPGDCGDAFHTFVGKRQGPKSSRFLYLKMRAGELASYGETAPIKGIIELCRDPVARMEMLPATTGDILKRTILQNFAQAVPALETLDRLHGLCEKAKRYTLHYPDGARAARFLVEALKPCP